MMKVLGKGTFGKVLISFIDILLIQNHFDVCHLKLRKLMTPYSLVKIHINQILSSYTNVSLLTLDY